MSRDELVEFATLNRPRPAALREVERMSDIARRERRLEEQAQEIFRDLRRVERTERDRALLAAAARRPPTTPLEVGPAGVIYSDVVGECLGRDFTG